MIPGSKPLLLEPLAVFLPPPIEPIINYDELTPNNVGELVTLVLLVPFKKASSE